MRIELRADGLHINGYVNVTGKKSRPVVTPHGRCIEVVEERAFERAIAKAGEVCVTVDHDNSHIYASTRDGTLKMYEDNIGLHADVLITDPDLIEIAKKGNIRGWSFGMHNVVDTLEQRTDDLPLRRIKDLELDHLTLVVKKQPCYAATSVEVRADSEDCIEHRAFDDEVNLIVPSAPGEAYYASYQNRIDALKNT